MLEICVASIYGDNQTPLENLDILTSHRTADQCNAAGISKMAELYLLFLLVFQVKYLIC